MKILFFIDSLTSGGKERRFSELLKGLNSHSEINFEVVVMNKTIHYNEVFKLNTKVHYLIRKSKKDLSVFIKFYKVCKEYKPDLVHTWDDMTSVIAVPACKLLNIILVNGMVVDTPVRQNISNKYWLRARLTFPFSRVVIGNSQAGLKAYGAPRKRSQCIYNGMDFNRFTNLKCPKQVKNEIFGDMEDPILVIGMIAAFEPRKDYETFIQAGLTLIEQNNALRFVLVGDGKQLKELKKMVSPKQRHKIIFLGRRTDVESIINIFDIGVLLTNTDHHGEGISNSIIEYMALRKPVIATTGGGTNEVVFDNHNGFLIQNRDEIQLISKINKLVQDYQLCKNFGENGFQTVYTKFNLELMKGKYIALYEKLIPKEIP